MDLEQIVDAVTSGVTPLIRTDYSDDDAWRLVVSHVSRPVALDGTDVDDAADRYAANIAVIDDRAFGGVDGRILGGAITRVGRISGYALLADARSMREASSDSGPTLDFVDLSVMDPEDADLLRTFTGHSFRVAAAEVAGIEANLSIANMDFHEFADATAPDGVFRGFGAAEFHEPDWPPEREAGLSAAMAVLADLAGGPAARSLTGTLGGIVLEREFADTRTRLFNRVVHASGWPLCMAASGVGSLAVGSEVLYEATLPESDDGYEHQGEIRTRIVQVDKPGKVVKAWNWLLPVPEYGPASRERRLLLERDAVVTIALIPADPDGDVEATRIRVEVVGTPLEWEADLRSLWEWDVVRLATRD